LSADSLIKESRFNQEGLAEAEHFIGKQWNEITINKLVKNSGVLFWFSDEAFCYYLPAFIVGSLVDSENAFDTYVDVIVGMLKDLSGDRFDLANKIKQEHGFEPNLHNDDPDEFESRWRCFTNDQVILIVDWLRWVDCEQAENWFESGLIDRAIRNLERVWHKVALKGSGGQGFDTKT
jgi:hypothetical protein